VVAAVQTVAVLFLRRAGGPADVVRIGLVLPVALAAQAALGMTHMLLLHVPIGAFMAVGLVRIMRRVWCDLPEERWERDLPEEQRERDLPKARREAAA